VPYPGWHANWDSCAPRTGATRNITCPAVVLFYSFPPRLFNAGSAPRRLGEDAHENGPVETHYPHSPWPVRRIKQRRR
jgi:hypothetical protein